MAVLTKCDQCHSRPAQLQNETVKDKATGEVKTMDICRPCLQKLTGPGPKILPTYECPYCPYGTFEPIAIHEHLKTHGISY